MGTTNDVSLSIALAADYGSAGKFGATWNLDRSLNVLIPSLGSNFLLKGRESLFCLSIIQFVSRCVNETKFLKLSPD